MLHGWKILRNRTDERRFRFLTKRDIRGVVVSERNYTGLTQILFEDGSKAYMKGHDFSTLSGTVLYQLV